MGGVNNSNKILDYSNNIGIDRFSNSKIKMTLQSLDFEKKSFVIYGLGLTGKSAFKFLKKQGVKTILTWDDFLKKKNNNDVKKFKGSLNLVDYIIISPGININSSIFKKSLIKNKKKILTDLDLFYLKNNLKKSIVITGTNGKSTTCSLVHHVLKKNKIQSKLAGNIGRPILDLKFSNRDVYVIEASSYHLEYSKFIKPLCAAILNISKDHLDWHGSKHKYIKAKFKIFINQDNKDKAFLKHNKFDVQAMIKLIHQILLEDRECLKNAVRTLNS